MCAELWSVVAGGLRRGRLTRGRRDPSSATFRSLSMYRQRARIEHPRVYAATRLQTPLSAQLRARPFSREQAAVKLSVGNNIRVPMTPPERAARRIAIPQTLISCTLLCSRGHRPSKAVRQR